jgi:hypothetical protein
VAKKAAVSDLRALIDATKSRVSPSAFEIWEAEDPKRAEEFWGHVEYARSKGVGWRLIVSIWNEERSPIPIKYEQVRLRHEARAASGKRPA